MQVGQRIDLLTLDAGSEGRRAGERKASRWRGWRGSSPPPNPCDSSATNISIWREAAPAPANDKKPFRIRRQMGFLWTLLGLQLGPMGSHCGSSGRREPARRLQDRVTLGLPAMPNWAGVSNGVRGWRACGGWACGRWGVGVARGGSARADGWVPVRPEVNELVVDSAHSLPCLPIK